MSINQPAQKTYAMGFLCLNCGHTFTQDIPYGKKVVELSWAPMGCFVGEDLGASLIFCPNCGVSEVRKDITWK